mmetsp:Transcript_28705/g.71855  ORF Transcript_28705/g.71855 Transcript_28705/m.71855 type:complete len:89 (-) Transcript_28705:1231-1497(-)
MVPRQRAGQAERRKGGAAVHQAAGRCRRRRRTPGGGKWQSAVGHFCLLSQLCHSRYLRNEIVKLEGLKEAKEAMNRVEEVKAGKRGEK